METVRPFACLAVRLARPSVCHSDLISDMGELCHMICNIQQLVLENHIVHTKRQNTKVSRGQKYRFAILDGINLSILLIDVLGSLATKHKEQHMCVGFTQKAQLERSTMTFA